MAFHLHTDHCTAFAPETGADRRAARTAGRFAMSNGRTAGVRARREAGNDIEALVTRWLR